MASFVLSLAKWLMLHMHSKYLLNIGPSDSSIDVVGVVVKIKKQWWLEPSVDKITV